MGFILICIAIYIKYKPQYQVSINKDIIGYVNSAKDIDEYINNEVKKDEGKNIAFIDLKNIPALKLELVNRNLENKQDELKNEISKQIIIEYTNYAISIDGKNKTYVASKEEAQKIVDEIEKEYDEKYTKKLGITQVYSDNYEEISAVNKKEAKTIISKEIKNIKQSDNKVKTTNIKLASSKKKNSVNGIKFAVKPVTGIITSRYGGRSSPGGFGSTNHKGLDIAASLGTPIYATSSGTVTYSGNKGELGNLIIINHGNGVETYYGHCSKLNVSVGEKVKAGDNIALVGKTGAATGYHLHFEVHLNKVAVNPQNYIY